jgi:hypothetical protein
MIPITRITHCPSLNTSFPTLPSRAAIVVLHDRYSTHYGPAIASNANRHSGDNYRGVMDDLIH